MPQYERGLYEPGEDVHVFDGSEEEEDVEGSRLPLLIVLALLVLAMFAGFVWLAYSEGVARGRSEIPVVTADAGPARVAPANPGGASTPYKGFKIYEQPAPPDEDTAQDVSPKTPAEAKAAPAPVTAAPAAETPKPAPAAKIEVPKNYVARSGQAPAATTVGTGVVGKNDPLHPIGTPKVDPHPALPKTDMHTTIPKGMTGSGVVIPPPNGTTITHPGTGTTGGTTLPKTGTGTTGTGTTITHPGTGATSGSGTTGSGTKPKPKEKERTP